MHAAGLEAEVRQHGVAQLLVQRRDLRLDVLAGAHEGRRAVVLERQPVEQHRVDVHADAEREDARARARGSRSSTACRISLRVGQADRRAAVRQEQDRRTTCRPTGCPPVRRRRASLMLVPPSARRPATNSTASVRRCGRGGLHPVPERDDRGVVGDHVELVAGVEAADHLPQRRAHLLDLVARHRAGRVDDERDLLGAGRRPLALPPPARRGRGSSRGPRRAASTSAGSRRRGCGSCSSTGGSRGPESSCVAS